MGYIWSYVDDILYINSSGNIIMGVERSYSKKFSIKCGVGTVGLYFFGEAMDIICDDLDDLKIDKEITFTLKRFK